LPQFRDDGNRRDLDVLVKTTDPHSISRVEEIGNDLIGDELELSIFGLIPMAELQKQRRQPIRNVCERFTADRYAIESDGRLTKVVKALFPFAVGMHLDSLETWQLFIGADDPNPTPLPHPGATILNYATRSISGVRPKDAKKLGILSNNVLQNAPEIKDWVMDGPGRSQVELARVLWSLRSLGAMAIGDHLLIKACRENLEEHRFFMFPKAMPIIKSGILDLTKMKARGVHFSESSPAVVTLWQRHAEKHAGKLVKNQ